VIGATGSEFVFTFVAAAVATRGHHPRPHRLAYAAPHLQRGGPRARQARRRHPGRAAEPCRHPDAAHYDHILAGETETARDAVRAAMKEYARLGRRRLTPLADVNLPAPADLA